MKKAKKIAIIVAVSMVVVGIVTTVGTLASVDFDMTEVNTKEWVTNTYTIEDNFNNISVQGGDAAVCLVPSADGICKVVCTENDVVYNEIAVVDNTLTIERIDNTKWYHNIGIVWEEIQITVYLPETEYENLSINNTSGRLEVPTGFAFAEAKVVNNSGRTSFMADVQGALVVENTSGSIYVGENTLGSLSVNGTSGRAEVTSVCAEGDVNVKTSSGKIDISEVECASMAAENSSGSIYISTVSATGDMEVKGTSGSIHITDVDVDGDMAVNATSGGLNLENVECTNLTAENNSGKISCTSVVASGDINLENSSGGIVLEACDAENLKLSATSGSIRGTLLTEKIFQADATSGSVDVPKTTSGGVCEVTTTSGSIKISIVE